MTKYTPYYKPIVCVFKTIPHRQEAEVDDMTIKYAINPNMSCGSALVIISSHIADGNTSTNHHALYT